MDYLYYILIGVLFLAMIAMVVVQARRQKKAQSDYDSMLGTIRVGMKVKMVSGLFGRVKEIREEAPEFKTIVLDVGDGKTPVLMTFDLNAVQGIVNEELLNKIQIEKAIKEAEAKKQADAAAKTNEAKADDAKPDDVKTDDTAKTVKPDDAGATSTPAPKKAKKSK